MATMYTPSPRSDTAAPVQSSAKSLIARGRRIFTWRRPVVVSGFTSLIPQGSARAGGRPTRRDALSAELAGQAKAAGSWVRFHFHAAASDQVIAQPDKPTRAAGGRPARELASEAAEKGERVPGSDLPDHPAARLDLDLRAVGRLAPKPLGKSPGVVLVRRPGEQEGVPADDRDSLRFEAFGQGLGVLVGVQFDADLPLGGPGLRRFGGFALLKPLVLLGDLLGGVRKRDGAVLPGLLDRMPALERGGGRVALVLDARADRSQHFTRGLLGICIEVDTRPVAADDHAVAESRALLALEIDRSQPLGELRSVALIVEIDRDSPVVGHRGRKPIGL